MDLLARKNPTMPCTSVKACPVAPATPISAPIHGQKCIRSNVHAIGAIARIHCTGLPENDQNLALEIFSATP
jgi:hypothetical protein